MSCLPQRRAQDSFLPESQHANMRSSLGNAADGAYLLTRRPAPAPKWPAPTEEPLFDRAIVRLDLRAVEGGVEKG